MRLAELSERSGLPIATIKYYLREGLLPPGSRINATTAEYGEDHLRRLRLVRALVQVGGIPVAAAKEVLGHLDDESLGRTIRLGAALWALPQGPEPDEDDPAVATARREVDRLLDTLGWRTAQDLSTISPVHRSLVTSLAALIRVGYHWDAEMLAPYAELTRELAVLDLDRLDTRDSDAERVETAVVAAVLFQPVLRALHRLAQEEESARRYGLE